MLRQDTVPPTAGATAPTENSYSVVFLDMDGVVSVNGPGTASQRLQRHRVARLNGILARTGCRVVVSSSWRENADASKLTAWLREAGFDGVVHDTTPVLEKSSGGWADPYVREREIEAWLRAQPVPPRAVAVLDDLRIGGRVGAWLVRTDEPHGLTEEDVERAVALLGEGPKKDGARAA